MKLPLPRRDQRRVLAPLLLLALVTAACGGESSSSTPPADAATSTVTVYTGRHYGIEPIFASFTEATGIEVRFTTGSDPELRERLLAEGENTPADVVMTADAANIALSSAAGLLAPLDSDALRDAIPAELRAEDDTWFSLSRRLRVIQYSSERVAAPPTTYAELAGPEYDGRLCLRPSTHPYTQSLVAALIRNEGADEAERIVEMVTRHKVTPIRVINTHAHIDHVGAVAEICRHYGVPFAVHAGEKDNCLVWSSHVRHAHPGSAQTRVCRTRRRTLHWRCLKLVARGRDKPGVRGPRLERGCHGLGSHGRAVCLERAALVECHGGRQTYAYR